MMTLRTSRIEWSFRIFRVVLIDQAGFHPIHAANNHVVEGAGFHIFRVALLVKPLRRRRQKLAFLHNAGRPRQELHFLPVADSS